MSLLTPATPSAATPSDPKELEAIQQQEIDICRDRVMAIINAGANVVFTTKAIDDIALKYIYI